MYSSIRDVGLPKLIEGKIRPTYKSESLSAPGVYSMILKLHIVMHGDAKAALPEQDSYHIARTLPDVFHINEVRKCSHSTLQGDWLESRYVSGLDVLQPLRKPINSTDCICLRMPLFLDSVKVAPEPNLIRGFFLANLQVSIPNPSGTCSTA